MLCEIELFDGCIVLHEFPDRITADGVKVFLFKSVDSLKRKRSIDYLLTIKHTPPIVISVEFVKIALFPSIVSMLEAGKPACLKLITRKEATTILQRIFISTEKNESQPTRLVYQKEFEKKLETANKCRSTPPVTPKKKGHSIGFLYDSIDDSVSHQKLNKTLSKDEIKKNRSTLLTKSKSGQDMNSSITTQNHARPEVVHLRENLKVKHKKKTMSVGFSPSRSKAFKQFFSTTTSTPRSRDEIDLPPEVMEEVRIEDWADETESTLIAPSQFAFHTMVGDRALSAEEFTSDHFLLEVPDQMNLYKLLFFTSEHANYIGKDDKLGPVVISLMFDKKFGATRCIIRVAAETENFQEESSVLLPLKFFLAKSKFELSRKSFRKVKTECLQKDIAAFDDSHLVSNFKFGVLYCKEGQTTEDEWFGNEHGSPAFDQFLDILGTRIQLEGWDKYRGGLDVQYGTTGKESIFYVQTPYQIMFHVSTLLPFHVDDEQKIERKRHIGNDIVVIIFADGDFVFTPETCKSVFIHIYIVVKPCDDPDYYTIGVTMKDGVKNFGPSFPFPPVIHKSMLQKFLIMKMLNGEWSAYGSLDFSHKFKRTRKMQLSSIIKDHAESD